MFALIWKIATLDVLADLYVAAGPGERERMAAGVEALNARRRSSPHDEGESRSNGFRVAFPPLLAVFFHVSEADRVVRVVRVQRYGR